MAEIAQVLQAAQLAIEGTIGTLATTGFRQLQSMSFNFDPQADVTRIEPVGQKFMSAAPVNREWTEWSYEGYPWDTELVYPLAATVGHSGTPATGGTSASATAFVWSFTPSNAAADVPVSFSIEQGDATRTHHAAGNIGRDFELTLSRAANSFSGVLFGQRFADGTVDLTAGATTLAKVPILPGQVDIYSDPTAGAIGSTKLLRDFVATLRVQNKYGPVWPLNSALTSWAAPVDLRPTVELELQVAADAEGMAFVDSLRNTATSYIRLQATGATIAGTSSYRMRIDGAYQVVQAPDPNDMEGVYAMTWVLAAVYDATLTKAISIEIVNAMSAF
jgi:hypothetical protein